MRRSSRDLPPNEGSVGELEKVLTVKDCPLCGYKTHKEMLYISERKLAEHIKYFCIGRNAEDAEESDIGVETSDLDYGAIRDANIARNAAFLAELGFNVEEVEEATASRDATNKSKRKKSDPESQGARKSIRQMNAPASAKNNEETITEKCEICGHWSPVDTPSKVAAYLKTHQETSDMCLQMQNGFRGGNGTEQVLLVSAPSYMRKERFDFLYMPNISSAIGLPIFALFFRKRDEDRKIRVDEGKRSGRVIWKCPVKGCYFEDCARDGTDFAQAKASHKAGHTRAVKKAGGVAGSFVEQLEYGDGATFDEECRPLPLSMSGGEEYMLPNTPEEAADGIDRATYFDNIRIEGLSAATSPRAEFDYSIVVGDCCAEPQVTVETADQLVYNHQKMVERIIRNPLDDIRGGKDVKANMDIYALGSKLGVTKQEGQLLLNHCRMSACEPGHIFQTWDGLRKAVRRKIKRQLGVKVLNIPLPEQYFGCHDISQNDLKPVKCYFYPILDRIGEACLAIDPKDFCKTFDAEQLDISLSRVYTTFPTAKLFQRFSIETERVHGIGVATLCVALFFDEANATGSRSANPLIGFILNALRDSFRPIFFGYCPLDLPYSDSYLKKLLTSKLKGKGKKKGMNKKLCGEIIRFARRNALQQFLKFVISPLLECGLVRLQIGFDRGEGSNFLELVVKMYFANAIGDAAALHDLGSVKLKACRWCLTKSLSSFGETAHCFPERDSKLMHNLCAELGSHMLDDFERACGKKTGKRTEEERVRRTYVERMGKEFSAIPGFNVVILLFLKYEEKSLLKFYRSLSIDFLHTLWKGLVEYAVAWSLQLVHYFSNFSVILTGSYKYRNGMALLDQRFAEWSGVKESLQPFRFVTMQAVSTLLKSESIDGKKQLKCTGIITGSLPAWQLPGVAMRILLCLGTDGSIVPNENIQILDDFAVNPTDIILRSLTSVVELCLFCESNCLNERQLNTFVKCIDNAQACLVEEFDFRKKVATLCRPRAKTTNDKKAGVIKPHMMSHIPEQIRDLAADSRSFNAAIGEKSHQVNVNWAFRSTSRKLATSEREMCQNLLVRELCGHVDQLSSCCSTRKNFEEEGSEDDDSEKEGDEGSESGTEEQFAIYQVIGNKGAEELRPTGKDSFVGPTKEGSNMNFLHPMCTSSELWMQLVAYLKESKKLQAGQKSKDNFIEEWYSVFTKEHSPEEKKLNPGRKTRFRLVGGVKCLGDSTTGFPPCVYRANQRDTGNGSHKPRPVFNSVEVSYDPSDYREDAVEKTTFAKIMALVVLGKNKATPPPGAAGATGATGAACAAAPSASVAGEAPWDEHIYFCVARYKRALIKGKGQMPFHEYKLETNKVGSGGLGLDFLSSDSIYRPCFMTGVAAQVEVNKDNFSRLRWFCLPFDRWVKHDNTYWDDFVGQTNSTSFKTSAQIEDLMTKMELPTVSSSMEGVEAMSSGIALEPKIEVEDDEDEESGDEEKESGDEDEESGDEDKESGDEDEDDNEERGGEEES